MRKKTRLLISTSVLVTIIGVIFFAGKPEPTSGQRMSDIPSNRKPACSIFCGDSTMNYVVLANPPACWGGPLPAGNAGDHYKDWSKADRKAICNNLNSPGRTDTSCPAFKTLMAACEQDEKEQPRSEPPRSEPQVKKPKCEPPDMPPWFDSDSRCIEKHKVVVLSRAISPSVNGIPGFSRCEVEYRICDSRIIKQVLVPKDSYPAACTKLGEDASRPFVCCEKWRGGILGEYGSCDPLENVDCDGMENKGDEFPLDPWPQFTGSYDPRNFYGERPPVPTEPCPGCKWDVIATSEKCEDSGLVSYAVLEFTWNCPANGKIVKNAIKKQRGSRCPATDSQP